MFRWRYDVLPSFKNKHFSVKAINSSFIVILMDHPNLFWEKETVLMYSILKY